MRASLSTIALLLAVQAAPQCTSFTSTPTPATRISKLDTKNNYPALNLKNEGDSSESSTTEATATTKNPLELASWYAVEAFGKAFGSNKSPGDDNNNNNKLGSGSIDFTKPPSSLDETIKRIRIDNDRSYFLSGEVDREIYDEECTFADPFVAFDGRDRFIDNLANLGSFITNYDAKMIKDDVAKEGTEVVTKVMVKLELNLPWKPVLAWPWGVTYAVDPETFLITTHTESWDIAPWEGVKQIFRKPTVKVSNK